MSILFLDENPLLSAKYVPDLRVKEVRDIGIHNLLCAISSHCSTIQAETRWIKYLSSYRRHRLSKERSALLSLSPGSPGVVEASYLNFFKSVKYPFNKNPAAIYGPLAEFFGDRYHSYRYADTHSFGKSLLWLFYFCEELHREYVRRNPKVNVSSENSTLRVVKEFFLNSPLFNMTFYQQDPESGKQTILSETHVEELVHTAFNYSLADSIMGPGDIPSFSNVRVHIPFCEDISFETPSSHLRDHTRKTINNRLDSSAREIICFLHVFSNITKLFRYYEATRTVPLFRRDNLPTLISFENHSVMTYKVRLLSLCTYNPEVLLYLRDGVYGLAQKIKECNLNFPEISELILLNRSMVTELAFRKPTWNSSPIPLWEVRESKEKK